MKKIMIVAAIVACVAALAGCSPKSTFTSEIVDATGAYKVTAENAEKGTSLGSLGGGIVVEDGQNLVVSFNLKEGSVQVRLLDQAGEVVLDEEASGSAVEIHEFEPGDYSIGVTCNQDGTTGTLSVYSKDKE